MRTTLIGASFLVFGAGAAVVGAKDNVALEGSDTLEHITQAILAGCPNAVAANITYRGGGSTTGGNAMVLGRQEVSPQSRALSTTEGCTNGGATSEGFVIALDGLSIVAKTTTSNACADSLRFSGNISVTDASGNPVNNCLGCAAGSNTYSLANWRDVIALVFGGQHHDTARTRDCASPVRRTLVDNFGSLFQNGCAAGTCPTGLQRAYRRADLSGTTDTFLSLVGLPSMPLAREVPGSSARPIGFCNAHNAGNLFGGDSDYLDLDPIRRACHANEQACARTGDLGLVTVVEIPANLPNADNYPTDLCTFGAFELLQPAIFGGPTTCPNGLSKLFNKCFQPVLRQAGGTFTAHCVARRFPVQGFQPNGMDGRSYNLWSKAANGSLRRDNLNRFITGAFYRLHTTTTIAAGAQTCLETSATAQIGCLTQANPCSIGFAGREASVVVPGNTVTSVMVNGLFPSIPNIEALVTTPDPADDYVLARKLYFNTIIGFENTTGGERELSICMKNNALVAASANAVGFVPVPGGVLCEDFAHTSCAASSTNACAGNPF